VTDAELVRAIQAGDAAAVQTLYERYLPIVWRYACNHLRNVHAAEDVVSETFLAAVRSAGDLDPDAGPVGAWLIGVARHKVGDWRRRSLRTVMCEAAVEAAAARPDDSPAPSERLEAAETRAEVARAMDGMPDDERLALEWKYLDGAPVREVAARLGRTEKAAEALLYRARRTFRALYERFRSRTGDLEAAPWTP